MFGTEDNSLRAFNCFRQLGDILNALWLLRSAGTDSSIPSKAADILDSFHSGEDMSFLRNRFALYGGMLTDITTVTGDEYLNYLFSSPDFRVFVENNISALAEMYREQSNDFSFNAPEDLFGDNGFVNFDDEDCDTDTSDTDEEDDEDNEYEDFDDDWDTDISDTDEDFEDLGTDTSDTDEEDDENDYDSEEDWEDFPLSGDRD